MADPDPHQDSPGGIDRQHAIEIARRQCLPEDHFEVLDTPPDGAVAYGDFSEPCWFVRGPLYGWQGTHVGGGRLIVVSKATGRVLYDGHDGGE